eukprot:18780-Heterococcus_DN1.PRE.1
MALSSGHVATHVSQVQQQAAQAQQHTHRPERTAVCSAHCGIECVHGQCAQGAEEMSTPNASCCCCCTRT